MKTTPIIILHGLGDNLLLFPVLLDYSLQHKSKLNLVVAKNYGSKSFWENIRFVNSVREITLDAHPRFWNIFYFYLIDYAKNIQKAKKITHDQHFIFLKISVLPLFVENILSSIFNRHKLTLAYNELHITPKNTINTISLEDYFKIPKFSTVLRWLKARELKKFEYICIHYKTFSESKSIDKQLINLFIATYPKISFIIIMTKQMQDNEENNGGLIEQKNAYYATEFDVVELYYVLKFAKKNIVIDSSIMHLACYTKTPTLAIFKVKKIKPKLILPEAKNITVKQMYTSHGIKQAMSAFI